MALVIVESPNKCSKIKKVLGNGYEVIASVGHIKDLEKKNMGIDTTTWDANYIVNPDKKDVVQKIKNAAKEHDEIYIATDDDREGSAIAFDIKSLIPKDKKIYRSIFKTITKDDIWKGINNPIPFDENLYKAQQARRMTDRIVGFKVSPVMWAKGLKNTSAGRVQSATLKWIVDKEKEIRAFNKEEYWTIHADMKKGFIADLVSINGAKVEPKTKNDSDTIISKIANKLKVSKYESKATTRSPNPPFITATLQQEANTKFGWSSKRTMDVAQALFANGLTTYIRSDSVRIDPEKINDLRDRIKQKFGQQYLSSSPIHYQNKDASQDAHEAIRPTFEPTPSTLSVDETRLLDLITDRFMASQMADAIFDRTSVELESSLKDKAIFKISGSILKFDGHLKVYGSQTKDVMLPKMSVGDILDVANVRGEQHFTKPPARFTDASFINKMKEDGVGRPSTYATVTETLIDHGYVCRDKKNLKPTEIGIMVSDYLSTFFKDIVDTTFTAKMEDDLDKIALGNLNKNIFMDSFFKVLEIELDGAKRGDPSVIFKTDIDCKSCADGSKMARKISKSGVFLGCENYPKCGHVLNYDEDGNVKESDIETGIPCPICKSKVVKKKGKFGEFWGCSSYPTCTWIGKIDSDGNIAETKAVEKTDIKCDQCKAGYMIKRQGKNGPWLGCSSYPKCKNTASLESDGTLKKTKPKQKLTGEKCPKCKKGDLLEREGKYGKFKGCSEFKNGCKYIHKEK